MKKILFLLLPLLLSACMSKPIVEEKPKTETPVNNEIIVPSLPPSKESKESVDRTKTETPPVKKTETTPKTSDPKTDEMTKELDSLIDEIVGG